MTFAPCGARHSGRPHPLASPRGLIARFICWHVQEQAFGGVDPSIATCLDRFARGDKPAADGPRRLKPGTVLVREYQGERHTVTVVPGGFVWRETAYPSLSTIARAITGTIWNGPRFFGLRASVNRRQHGDQEGIARGAAVTRSSPRLAGSVSTRTKVQP